MEKYIIVMSLDIWKPHYLKIVARTITLFKSVIDWSIDLDDKEKVLRVTAEKDVSTKLSAYLGMFGAECRVLEVFKDPDDNRAHGRGYSADLFLV
ncbi:hypothetical protein [Pedobacter sp. GR22-6]|uniref:hypothetical protein n=1 Tax=Pedobacter sp. GR22-6 TaxID=3127957 RepID=UPI00307D83E3